MSHPMSGPAVLFMALLTGCSLFGSRTQQLSVRSSPPGAEVWLNGELAGITPFTGRIRRWGSATIVIKKDGYRTVERATTKSLSGLGITDVVFGSFVILPYLGLLSGAAWEQTPSDLNLNLAKYEGHSQAASDIHKDSPSNRRDHPLGIEGRLRELKDLRSQGVISQQEYDKIRTDILDDL